MKYVLLSLTLFLCVNLNSQEGSRNYNSNKSMLSKGVFNFVATSGSEIRVPFELTGENTLFITGNEAVFSFSTPDKDSTLKGSGKVSDYNYTTDDEYKLLYASFTVDNTYKVSMKILPRGEVKFMIITDNKQLSYKGYLKG